MDPDKLKHLEFLQGAINRTNTNSFQIKGLAITIVAAILAIYASNPKQLLLLMPIPSCLLFWFIDAYYLMIERRLRGIYTDVIGVSSYNTVANFDFPLASYDKNKSSSFSYFYSFISSSILPIYTCVIIFLVVLYLITS